MPKGIYHRTEEQKRKIGDTLRHRKLSLEHRRNMSIAFKGRKVSEVTRNKISATLIRRGIKPTTSRIGMKLSDDHKKKISMAHKGKHVGEKNNSWKGGISFEPYSIDWTQTLRRSIRERDRYVCNLCLKQQDDKAFDVHHIDYNRKNCNPDNLITLCHSCHMKTNFNRKYWINLFKPVAQL